MLTYLTLYHVNQLLPWQVSLHKRASGKQAPYTWPGLCALIERFMARIVSTQRCAPCTETHRLSQASSRTWGNVTLHWPLRQRPNRANSMGTTNKTDELRANDLSFLRFTLSKFSVTLRPRLIKTSSCCVGTQNKQACSPCSVPTHNLIKRHENYAMPWASYRKHNISAYFPKIA